MTRSARRSPTLGALGVLAATGLTSAACDEVTPLETAKPVLQLAADALDFGPVPEGTRETRTLMVLNPGPVPLSIQATFDEAGSRDFTLVAVPPRVSATSSAMIEIEFVPAGGGSDEAILTLTSDDPERPSVPVRVTGGPIGPVLVVSPDPVDFGPASSPIVTRPVALRNTGTSSLHLESVALDPAGNPDFALRESPLPGPLAPGAEHQLVLDYTRSTLATAGRLVVRSDDPASPEHVTRLLPDPLRACQDGQDNDDDGLSDFPNDPGCTADIDDDEANPPECDEGTTMPCGTAEGSCELGTRTCTNRLWGPCEGGSLPVDEACDSADNDCDGRVDEELTEPCSAHGCAGVRACVESSSVAGGLWTDCVPIAPEPETCDGRDNDCDGVTDDGVVEVCTELGCTGTRICVPGGSGQFTSCQVNSSPEVCNGADDDCDGTADNGIPELVCGVGACRAQVPACSGGAPNTCTPGQSAPEVCNGADDDCDGITDNNLADLTCGLGVCLRSVPACSGGAPNTCTPGASGPELCNGLDDDCNGSADDGGACGGSCGLMTTAADPQEPNNAAGSARPNLPYTGNGSFTYEYDLTLTPGDNDWIQLQFPPAGAATFASLNAEITCVSWAGAGCGAPPTVGLAAWYFDSCFPQQDDLDNGQAGLASVTSNGAVSSLGFCDPQLFRVHAFASTTVCAQEAANAHLRITVSWSP